MIAALWSRSGRADIALLTASTVFLSPMVLPPLLPSSAVNTHRLLQSSMRPLRDSEEKPANTMEWMAPMRAQASMVMASSGIMGMYRVTTSPVHTVKVGEMWGEQKKEMC